MTHILLPYCCKQHSTTCQCSTTGRVTTQARTQTFCCSHRYCAGFMQTTGLYRATQDALSALSKPSSCAGVPGMCRNTEALYIDQEPCHRPYTHTDLSTKQECKCSASGREPRRISTQLPTRTQALVLHSLSILKATTDRK